MVTEKPPRRPKSKKEPVTIDVTAEEAAVAEPVRSNDTDDDVSAGPETSVEEDWAPKALSDAGQPSAEKASAPTETDSAVNASRGADKPQPLHDEAGPGAPPAATPPPAHRDAATSTLIAAGIFGGIVALALAGSMQYAGYLPAATKAPDVSVEIAALRQEVEVLRQAPAADPGLDTRLQAIETALAQRPADDATEKLSAIEQELAAVRTATESAASDNAGRLEQLQGRLDAAEAKLNEPGEGVAAARAIAAAALKAAVDRGGSFGAELETFARTAPDDPALAQLQTFGAQGVPSREQLVERLPGVTDAVLSAIDQPDPDQGMAQRLMSSALSVVKVRRTGDVEGDTPEAIVARMDNALKGGDLQAAAAEWEKLPEEAKAVSRDFKQTLDARIAVDGLIGETLVRAVSETGTQN
jgi:hypothetical protein